MAADQKELDTLLELIKGRIDLEHCRKVDERYRRALAWEKTDRPPLVVQAPYGKTLSLPEPWDKFKRYGYRETFENPAAMLQNMLLDQAVPGLLLKDDNPLAIRNNHGTIQVAGVLGGNWKLPQNDFPWVEPFNSIIKIKEVAYSKRTIDLHDGVRPQSFRTLEFYRQKLSAFPPCQEAIQISMPDLQGPMDTAEQLWGSSIYYAFTDHPEILERLLSKITDTMLAISEQFRKYATDRLDSQANTQHGYVIPGRLLIRDDSSIMLSPDTYAEFIRPHDTRLLREIGTGSIHFCGNGKHLIEKMLDIPDLAGFDFGQPELMDITSVYALCRSRSVTVTNLHPLRQDLVSGKARNEFPTGVVFVYQTDNFDDAFKIVEAYGS